MGVLLVEIIRPGGLNSTVTVTVISTRGTATGECLGRLPSACQTSHANPPIFISRCSE